MRIKHLKLKAFDGDGTKWLRFISIFYVLAIVILAGCVSTEPVKKIPNVNLSPEKMRFETDGDANNNIDLGLALTTNESDSLDNLEVLPGLRVRSVRAGGAADSAGIKAGDIILQAAGTEVNQVGGFIAIAEALDKDSLSIRAIRGTTVFETTMQKPRATVATVPTELHRIDQIKTRAAYQTQVLTDTDTGRVVTAARVVALLDESPLRTAGVEPDDLILAINDNAVQSAQDFINQIHNNHELGDKVILTLLKGESASRNYTDVSVKLWDPGSRIEKVMLWPLFSYRSALQPSETEFKIINFFGLSLFAYKRSETEKEFTFFSLLHVGSGAGELVEETPDGVDP